jgi:hypothetical protein
MLAIILFLPRGILPTLQDWLERRRAPRAAFAGAHSMAEMMDNPTAAPSASNSNEAELPVIEEARS